jgi:ComF family protein
LKYRRDLGLGEVLARHLILIAEENTLPQDVIIPIPLGKRRRNERGYNQAALLARPLALALNISYRPRALKRIRETKSQVGLSFAQRRENVSGAFEAVPKLVSGRRVLLVDDVMTTGATLEAAAQALKNAGAADVQGLTLVKTVKFV